MWRINIKKILFIILSTFVVVIVFFIIVGGGFGDKQLSDNVIFSNNIFFAHRGTTGKLIPENTLASIRKARNLNFKAVEIDIQQTKEGIFILFHDEYADRLLKKNIKTSQNTLNDIRKFTLYDPDSIQTGLDVSTLDDVFKLNGDSLYYYLDMKGLGRQSYFSLADEIAEKIKKQKLENKVFVASASLMFALYTEFNYPELNTVIEGFGKGKEWIFYWIPKKIRPDFISSFAADVDSSHVEWLKEHNLISRKIVYGVDETNYLKMKKYGIKKMIIDYGLYLDNDLK